MSSRPFINSSRYWSLLYLSDSSFSTKIVCSIKIYSMVQLQLDQEFLKAIYRHILYYNVLQIQSNEKLVGSRYWRKYSIMKNQLEFYDSFFLVINAQYSQWFLKISCFNIQNFVFPIMLNTIRFFPWDNLIFFFGQQT